MKFFGSGITKLPKIINNRPKVHAINVNKLLSASDSLQIKPFVSDNHNMVW